MPSDVSVMIEDERRMVAIAVSEGEWRCYLPSEIKKIYNQSDTLRSMALFLGITPLLARKALQLAGVDYLRDLYGKRQTGKSFKEIATDNGMKRSTLTK
ncbi:hypothetical protein [Ruegeria atlantica]|uniref:hypothetical protein n=1 Tax=Ruegeria atlantica TaxID=81569 RepID=UPI00147BB6EC|nr:hypothetical protein [Ruegeria atlantica]